MADCNGRVGSIPWWQVRQYCFSAGKGLFGRVDATKDLSGRLPVAGVEASAVGMFR